MMPERGTLSVRSKLGDEAPAETERTAATTVKRLEEERQLWGAWSMMRSWTGKPPDAPLP